MPRYLTPKTTWYKNRAIKQLSPMLASPKKVRKTTEGRGKKLINIHIKDQTLQINAKGMRSRSYCTREGGEDEDEHSDAGSTDHSQHHVVVEGVSHLIIEQLCASIQHLHLAETRPPDTQSHQISTVRSKC